MGSGTILQVVALLLAAASPAVAGPPEPGDPATPWKSVTASPAEKAAPSDESLLQGFLPKEDMAIPGFLAAHPDGDGRGVIVAILDTGLDVGQSALQTTSTGAPKILDVFDATDNGFLPLPLSVRAGAPGPRGLTGRLLRLPGDLPEDATVRLGILIGRDLFPEGLHQRRQAERRAAWARLRDRRAAELAPEGTAGSVATPRAAGDPEGSNDAEHEEALREALDRLTSPDEDSDPGDRYDVAAVARDGGWEVLIDRDADGDLAEESPLRPYRERHEVLRFEDPTQWSVAVDRIAPGGKSVFLFFDENGHGTHVAGIVAGNYGPGDPLNGLAPGAQLLGVKVGNGRMGGATSHDSIARAAQWAVDHGADVLNISFGGGSFFGDGNDPTAAFLDDLVERTGVVICCSAGNAGPALSTVGSPATARRVFAWGAAISRKTQQTNYGALDPRRDDLFHFSSRGPLLDGDPGIDFISPGAALSPLPTWGLVRGESWNGTSMASPQGAGFSACVISACRAEGVPVTPERLRRAMRMGARELAGIPVIEQGDGIPQAEATFDALRALAVAYPPAPGSRDPVIGWRIEAANATGTGGGIYTRDLRETNPYFVEVFVRPDLPVDSLQHVRAGFLRIVRLASEAAWMRAPLQQSINSGGIAIRVQIDPARMEPGLNVGRIVARDVAHPGVGSEFAIVATIVRPEDVDPTRPVLEGTWSLDRGDRRGVYVRVPAGACRARLRVRESLAEPANAYEIALADPDIVRLSDHRGTGDRLVLSAGQERTMDLAVRPGLVLECAAFSRWHTNNPGRLDWRLEFSGIEVDQEQVLVIPRDRPGAGCIVGSLARAAGVRLDARIDRRVEPLALEWTTREDSLVPWPMNGLPAVVHQGVGLLPADGGEDVAIDLQTPPELEDFLDDAIFRVTDDSQREIGKGYLSEGSCTFHAPHAGVFRVTFSIFARGGRIFEEAAVVTPVILRSMGPHALRVHRTAPGAYANGPDSLAALTLRAGERRRLFVRASDLPEGGLLRGRLEIRGEPSGDLFAEIPILADTRTLAPARPDEDLTRMADAAAARARLLARRADISEAEWRGALEDLLLCERLRAALPGGTDAARRTEHGRKRGDDEEELPPDESWMLREARAGLLAAHAGLDELREAVRDLRDALASVNADSPEAVADRRAKEATAEGYEAALALRAGDREEARRHLDRARGGDPGRATFERLEVLTLAAEGEHAETRRKASLWLRSHPDDALIDAACVRSLIGLGWSDLARIRLAGWARRHPAAAAEGLTLWSELDAAAASSPSHGLLDLAQSKLD